jgi:uncharacterized membrane protein
MHTHTIQPTATGPLHRDQARGIALDAPFDWLVAGIHDFQSAPGRSLLYGAVFAAGCGVVTVLTLSLPWFTLAFLTGLLLMGPYLATGLYVAARQLEAGEAVSIREALRTLAARKTNLALFALFLVIVMDAWVRIASLLFAFQFDVFSPSIQGYLGILSGHGDPMVLVYFVGIGFLLAATVFVTCAVSVPLIVDRDRNLIEAIGASARIVRHNWTAMLVWATLIVILTTIGIATFFVGFVVLFPVLGYATWHSYRAMVE